MDNSEGDVDDARGRGADVVTPWSGIRPRFVALRQVRVHEFAQASAVAERGHATFGFGNPLALELNFQLLGDLPAAV